MLWWQRFNQIPVLLYFFNFLRQGFTIQPWEDERQDLKLCRPGRPEDKMRETGSFMHPWLLTARALGGSRHKHTGRDLETIYYFFLLPVAPGWTPTWELGIFT